jgi:serine/threonine-protein kinase RsbW
MALRRRFTASARVSIPCSTSIELRCSLPSKVALISSFVDNFISLLTTLGCIPGSEGHVEIALREALNNAAVHGNHEDPTKCVGVRCRSESGDVSIDIRDGGIGFDVESVPDPTVPENIFAPHGRGIYLMKTLMD